MIIFLFGEDSFRSSRKVQEIKKKFLSADKSGSGLSVFDCEEEKEAIGKIIDALKTTNLLASKRLVIGKNLISGTPENEQKKILEFLKNKKRLGEDKDIVVIFWERSQPKKTNALYKFLKKNARSQNFEKLFGIKLENWTLKSIKEINPQARISKKALAKLIAFCADDNFLLFNEIQKLIDYVDKEMISEKDIDLLVKTNLNSSIFQLVDAIGANNKKEALSLLHEHLEKGTDPFYLLSMFFYQFRNMLKVLDLYNRGARSEFEISKTAKLHPFVAKKTLAQVRNFSFEKLKDIYKKLGELDMKIKTGKIEVKLGLDKFVGEL